jgi:hypothetical protein
MAFTLVLGSESKQVVYEPKPSRESGQPEVFRIKSDVRDVPVGGVDGNFINSFQEIDNSEITTVTVDEAVTEIRHYVSDLSGYSESEIRRGLSEIST